jgi:hypothetical protein
MTSTGAWIWDKRIKNSDITLVAARKLHSKEIHIIVGSSDELEFPEGLSERCKIGMLGKVMNGHCVRALGEAAHSYLHQSPAQAQCHPAAFATGHRRPDSISAALLVQPPSPRIRSKPRAANVAR